jgi:preprotein translocase subunit SecF
MGFGWKLTISFVLLFLIGALCGVALTLAFDFSHETARKVRAQQKWEENVVRKLTKRLKLDASQQSQARTAIHDVVAQIRSIQRQQQIENITLFDKALEKLNPILSSDQQRLLDRFRERRKQSLLKKFGSRSPGTPASPTTPTTPATPITPASPTSSEHKGR